MRPILMQISPMFTMKLYTISSAFCFLFTETDP